MVDYRHWVYLLATLALCTALYWPGLNGPFLLDDTSNTVLITLNTWDWEKLRTLALINNSGFMYRPLANISFALNSYFTGLNPWPYKFTNLVIHLLTGLAFFRLTRLLLAGLRATDESAPRDALWACLAAALWLLHPLQVSTTLYVVQRMAQLTTLFSALALSAYVQTRVRSLRGEKVSYGSMAAIFALYAVLAVLGKENAVLLPLFVLAIEGLIFRLRTTNQLERRRLALFHLVFIATPLAAGFFYAVIHSNTLLAGYTGRSFTLGERLLTESNVIWYYLRMIALPDLTQLSLYHDDYPVQHAIDLPTALSLAGIAALAALPFVIRKRAPLAALGIAWFIISHLLESTFLPLELVFEHRNYIALYGLSLLPLQIAVSPIMSTKSRVLMPMLCTGGTIYLGLLVLVTALLARTWSDRETLLRTLAEHHPDSARLEMELINYDLSKKDFTSAYHRVDRIKRLMPWDPSAEVIRVSILCGENRNDSELINHAAETISHHPKIGTVPGALLDLSRTIDSGKCPTLSSKPELERLFLAIIQHPQVRNTPHLAQLTHVLHARLLYVTGRRRAAIDAFEKAYRARTSELDPLFEKAYVELNSGWPTEAAATLTRIKGADHDPMRYYQHRIRELEQYVYQALAESSASTSPE